MPPATELVSVIIPAFQCQSFISQAIQSALNQTWRRVEVLVVADDRADYAGVTRDLRVRFFSTGVHGGGPSLARNLGFAQAKGDYVVFLDADDIMQPSRLRALMPLARQFGAACDNAVSRDMASGAVMGYAFAESMPARLGLDAFLAMNRPLTSPLIRRDKVPAWDAGLRFAEDVMFNLNLIQATGGIALSREHLMDYRVRSGSLSHAEDSHLRADEAYGRILENLHSAASGYVFPLDVKQAVLAMFERKRALNQHYAEALQAGLVDNFSEFALKLESPETAHVRNPRAFGSSSLTSQQL